MTQREENGLGSLYDYNARFYSPVLGRFLSADTIVPDLKNPQSLNRLSYVYNNPLTHNDPSGHCTGDQNDKNNPDYDCWQQITLIQSTYTNITIDPALWTAYELKLVLQVLGSHPFKKFIAQAESIMLERKSFLYLPFDGVAGETYQNRTPDGTIIPGKYTMTIWNDAWFVPPDANHIYDFFPLHFTNNFAGTLMHEFSHIAAYQNQGLLDSFRQGMDEHPEQFDPLKAPIGKAYDYRLTAGSADDKRNHQNSEMYAMTVATYYFQHSSLVGTWEETWMASFK